MIGKKLKTTTKIVVIPMGGVVFVGVVLNTQNGYINKMNGRINDDLGR